MASRYDDNQKRSNKKKGNPVVSFLTTVLLIAAIAVFAYSAYKLVGYYLDYKAGTDEYDRLSDTYAGITITPEVSTENTDGGTVIAGVDEVEDPDAEAVQARIDEAAKEETVENGETKSLPLMANPIDFTQLQSINEEIIGWIRIGALDVSYPICQAADNDFYLHRTFEKQDNFAGCIFLNYSNSKYFTDQNTLVYGHNMKNGSMFGTLKKFREQETYDSNPYFWIFTPTLIYQYRIFSAREVALNAECDVYNVRYTTEDFQSFLDTAQAQNLVDTHGLTVTTEDRVTTLSTCTGNDATRFIVQGVLEQVYLAK